MSHNKNTKLWKRLEQFEFDSGTPSFGFSDRLARENGWTQAETEKVILEYKRFVFLAMTAGHPVTPSETVDQVWHLHLTYTKSYWNSLCKELLGKPLHHNPTEGGSQERAKFQDWYLRTLESYRTVFGEEPAEEIWPIPDDRFRNVGATRWVDTSTHWIIDRGRFLKVLGGAFLTLVLLGCFMGAVPLVAKTSISWFGIAVFVGILLLSFALGKDSEGGCGDGGCGCGGCGGCG